MVTATSTMTRNLLFSAVFLLPLLVSTSLLASSPQHVFTNPPHTDFRIPTVHESAVQARRIFHISSIATLSTVFPSSTHTDDDDLTTAENRPSGLGGMPIGMMEYYADCEPGTGNPTILAVDIATSFKNVAAGSNVSFSLRYHPPAHHRPSRDPFRFAPSNLPRFALLGYLERMSESEVREKRIAECFVRTHPDARLWVPGNDIHESHWARLVVREFYWFGGFGDRARIGWVPVEEWRNVTMDEVEKIRLPGEEDAEAGASWW